MLLAGGAFGPSLSFWADIVLLLFLIFPSILRAETLMRGGRPVDIAFTGGGVVRGGDFLPAFRMPAVSYDLYLSREVFVSFGPDMTVAEKREIAAHAGGELVRPVARTEGFWLVSLPYPSIGLVDRIADMPGVRRVEPDTYRPMAWRADDPDDPLFPHQWHLENRGQVGRTGEDAKVAAAWRYLYDAGLEPGRGIRVGVIDDGFDLAHTDLAGAFLAGIDLFDGDDLPMIGQGDLHGTAVAGVLAARVGNGIGVAGACGGCLVIPVRVSAELINGVTEIDAFNYLLDREVDIISNSWGPADHGGPMDMSEPLKEIIAWAAVHGRGGRGVTILFAAGNGNEDISDPHSFDGYAANPWVVAVGAVNASGVRTVYSDWGRDLDILAPSCDTDLEGYADPFDPYKIRDGIWTTDNTGFSGYAPGDHTATFCGTSSAAPLAAGVAALLLSAAPSLTREELYGLLTGTADKVSPRDARYDGTGFSERYGFGRIDALAAIEELCAQKACEGAPADTEEPIEPLGPEVDFVENLNTVSDEDLPLVTERPVTTGGGCSFTAL